MVQEARFRESRLDRAEAQTARADAVAAILAQGEERRKEERAAAVLLQHTNQLLDNRRINLLQVSSEGAARHAALVAAHQVEFAQRAQLDANQQALDLRRDHAQSVQSGLLEQAQDALHGAEVEEKMAKDEERIVRREAARLEEEAMDASLAMDAAVLEEAMLREAAIQYAAEVEGMWRTANFKQAKSRASYPAERESWLTLCFPPFLSSPLLSTHLLADKRKLDTARQQVREAEDAEAQAHQRNMDQRNRALNNNVSQFWARSKANYSVRTSTGLQEKSNGEPQKRETFAEFKARRERDEARGYAEL